MKKHKYLGWPLVFCMVLLLIAQPAISDRIGVLVNGVYYIDIGALIGSPLPADLPVLTSTASDDLSNETDYGALSSGVLSHTVAAGVSTPAATGLPTGGESLVTLDNDGVANLRRSVTMNLVKNYGQFGITISQGDVNAVVSVTQSGTTSTLTNPSGTDLALGCTNFGNGTLISVYSPNLNALNTATCNDGEPCAVFTVSGCVDDDPDTAETDEGSISYTNASGVTEADITIAATGYIYKHQATQKAMDALDFPIGTTGGIQFTEVVNATDGTHNGTYIVRTVDAGVGSSAFGQCYHVDTDGELVAADADAITTMPCVGLAITTGVGASKTILTRGIITETDWNWTVGAPIYVSGDPTTTSGLTETQPSGQGDQVQVVGRALSADTILFDPSPKVEVIECFDGLIPTPNDYADALRDAFRFWQNNSGRTFTVTYWRGQSGADNTTLNIETTDSAGANNATVDAVELAADGTGLFHGADADGITAGTVLDGWIVWFDFDDTDTPPWVGMSVCGKFSD